MNTTRKLCKNIKNETECISREDCLYNTSKKCQKRPTQKIREKIVISSPSPQEKPLSSTKCKEELANKREMLNFARRDYDSKIKECEHELYSDFIKKYFNESPETLNHSGLLIGLQKYYKDKKNDDVNFILNMHDFIHSFSQKMPVYGTNYKRQHIFEAICRLLLYFNYDNGELGLNKKFYKSLEGFLHGEKNEINDDILQMNVNESSSAGIVDIFFKRTTINDDDHLWGCNTHYSPENQSHSSTTEYVMIQNKYYDSEKTNISNYDVTRIYSLANLANKENTKFDGPFKIILMVNNGDAVSTNLLKAKQQYPKLLDETNGILGVSKLNVWFQALLYDLLVHSNIQDFLREKGKKHNYPQLQLRFHQEYIVNCSQQYFHRGINKLIWGAVPRSGKSYIIGGLIDARYKAGIRNNVVIILGALTETLHQFKEMFMKHSNFEKYTVITPDYKKDGEGDLNIYLISQEWFKDKINDTTFNAKFNYHKMFDHGKIDLYFDEVHKGGSTDKSENIIHALNPKNIDMFVMVTATFMKPSLRYNHLIIGSGKEKTEVIEWTYTDQQLMKTIRDETKKEILLNTRDEFQKQVLRETFDKYQQYYGMDYLNTLANEYSKHPELVLISPQSIPIHSSLLDIVKTTDMRNVFIGNMKCTACEPSKPLAFYKSPANIFNNLIAVDGLLDYISLHIYNYFKNQLRYNIDAPHTELWFLPDKNLYNTNDCKSVCKSLAYDTANNDEEENLTLKGIPNIEPLTRGLALKICSHELFSRYNVLIVHNTKLTYLDIAAGGAAKIFDDYEGRVKMFANDKRKASLSQQIKQFEKESYMQGKSLIVLTGAKLRLGISLPCADIAFNFDDIKSIDNNYQTMFRVLTERETPTLKKYGYYLDMNKERAIQFIYEYNKIYGEAKKMTNREAIESLQSLLFTFNYNGLNLIKGDTQSELRLYHKLCNDLQLNEQGYAKFWSERQNIVGLIKKTLTFAENTIILQQLQNVLQWKKSTKGKQRIKYVAKTGRKRKPAGEFPTDDTSSGDDTDADDDTDDDESFLINSIAEELPSIIVLLALFSDNMKCDTIQQCLKFSLANIEHIDYAYCACDTIDDANILDCFFNSPENIRGIHKYDATSLSIIIQLLLQLVETENDTLIINLNFIFDNIKKAIMKSNDNAGMIRSMSYEDIQNKIQQYLSVREDEKNKYGEVFTPISLIEEMLEKLPKNVWKNPDLKWLDPANGIGNFPMVAYTKLMEGLKEWEPSDALRSKHIIKNMLYMVEINPKNVRISKKIFGPHANISCANFLEQTDKWVRDFNGVNIFDIVIGNPPFQPDKTEQETRAAGKGVQTLWDKFIKQSLELLVPHGYLCFITPSSWRKPDHALYSLMTRENQLLYLHIYGKKDGQKLFNVKQRIDLYIIQKRESHKSSEIIDEMGDSIEVNASEWPFLPNYAFNNIKKIITREETGIHVMYDTFYHSSIKMNKTKREKTSQFKYPVVHLINQEGLSIIYADDNTKGHFKEPKVLLNANEKQYPVNDFDGKYGMSQLTFGIPITSKRQGDDIVKAINSDAFKEILNATKWGAFQTDYKMFKYFKPDFYKYFLKDTNAAKIQAVARGYNQRKQTKKHKGGRKYTRKNRG